MRLPTPVTLGVAGLTGCVALAVGLPAQASPQADEAFDVTSVATDADGVTHTRMDRTLDGLEVVGGDVVTHRGPGGRVVTPISETLTADLAGLDTTPAVSAESARRGVARDARAPQLVVDALDGTPRLAWRTYTVGTQEGGAPSRLATYVDAETGEVLRSEEEILAAGRGGYGTGRYSGRVPLYLHHTVRTNTYVLSDPRRGQIRTRDMLNREDSFDCVFLGRGCSVGAVIAGKDRFFGDGTLRNRETSAVDVQYASQKTYDYFASMHALRGVDGTGRGHVNRVHYGRNMVNAFWDGTRASFGDGDGRAWGPLTTLDVVSHEIAHGVTQHTANLAYTGEAGGLNESTSDIFASLVEFHAKSPKDGGDYLLGEKADLRRKLGLRRMDDPRSDGRSWNCWGPGLKNLDPHYSSGVGNHFFYLLSEGTAAKRFAGVTHRSPTCDGSSFAGIGRDKAGAIWFRALSTYMSSGTTYLGARRTTLQAAADLYGPESPEYAAVDVAWDAVKVPRG